MRELTIEELNSVQGGFLITTTVILAVISLATAGVYLVNTLATMIYNHKTGGTTPQPSSQDLSQVASDVTTIANTLTPPSH